MPSAFKLLVAAVMVNVGMHAFAEESNGVKDMAKGVEKSFGSALGEVGKGIQRTTDNVYKSGKNDDAKEADANKDDTKSDKRSDKDTRK